MSLLERDGGRTRIRARRDALGGGTPDVEREKVLASVRRLPNGRAATREDMAKLGSLGGKAGKERAKIATILSARMGQILYELIEDAATFRRQECSRLARLVGGGVCGSAPASFVAS